ncbi:Vacuolar protein sorting-associated protein 72-like protein [Colletotrichum spinosum]|uniref:Vacuolar protein sorting-associated protein 72-like protein n=1 Tax=Colletotrichum spinosum TaxID=1347390 RepID=A0A4R8Q2H7_9PEZI|nr:Vacuolar protein sorting-associated protein 72-like protein [Colletotrichum spinosum]
MAVTENFKPSSRDESSDSGSDSENDSPLPAPTPTQVEWLATGRAKRSTAGNRMKSMLANEEPDSDLELLFAEDDNDEGFTEVDDAASDVHMDSSSDDEDEQNQGDDMEGEKELEKQAREKKAASRKRKAQEAIPAKFRKKVRIETNQTTAPAPRPKKKSERTSWLPSVADMPTRASLRQTTMLSKEQLHNQMKEREAKRLKQLARMEKNAKRLEALKKPPMTQAERLAEAALVEKRNAKSLNRWEEAEKAREEERLAKLQALKNRTLKGPVVTYWSGIGEWEHHLKHVGRVAEEEKAPRKKREKKEKVDKAKGKEKDDKDSEHANGSAAAGTPIPGPPASAASVQHESKPVGSSVPPTPGSAEKSQPNGTSSTPSPTATSPIVPSDLATSAVKVEDTPRLMAPPPMPPPPTLPAALPRPDDKPWLMAPPCAPPPSLGISSLGPPPIPPPPPPPPPKTSVLAAPVLAPPVLAPPVLAPPLGGIHLGQPNAQPKSNVLAPPNTSQHQSPLSMPAPALAPLQPVQPPAPPPQSPAVAAPAPPPAAEPAVPEEPPPSEVARNAFILRNFDEDLIGDKTTQTRVLFGRRMDRLAKPAPRPVCVITAHPARYRDPTTGLPYFNAYAYREIQRIRRGDYKWSGLVGAWVGSCNYAARGVPERFLKGDGKPKNKTKEIGTVTPGETTEKPGASKADGPVSSQKDVQQPDKKTVETAQGVGVDQPETQTAEKTVVPLLPSAQQPPPQPGMQTQPPEPQPQPQSQPQPQTLAQTQTANAAEAAPTPGPTPVAASATTVV